MGEHIKECAVLGIAAVEMVALYMGHNGAILALAVAAIAGIAGFEIGQFKK